MNKQDLAELLKYSSSQWLYVITWNNVLHQVITPFRVVVLKPVGMLVRGQIMWVEEVKITLNLTTVFIVEGSAYYYYHFDILID
ncbi:hypothetical protein [Maribacter dokdonensis]|uniref:hypothetical protein n=1 Tax=Maribacter dokdonensis TaxID=320912 RepID=UPI00329853AC